MAASNNRPHRAMTPQLHLITCCPSPGIASVVVTGEVDMATEAALRAVLLGALATHHPVVLDLDLSACTFLDCSGVRVLVAVLACAKATGCLVRARHAQPAVRLVLEITGLLALLTAPADASAVAGGHDSRDRARHQLVASIASGERARLTRCASLSELRRPGSRGQG